MSTPSLSSETVHASAVAIAGRAVLIGGRSGHGKSDLALRLIDRGARLISDDYTFVRRSEGRAVASAPPTILGKIEMRGVGLIELETEQNVPVALYVDLDNDAGPAARAGRGDDARRRVDPDRGDERPRGFGAAQGRSGAEAVRPGGMTEVRILSFAYSKGAPPAANLVLDMRFLRNPHWQEELRDLCGLDAAVGDYIAGDEAYDEAVGRIEELLLTLLPRYAPTENPRLGRVRLYRRDATARSMSRSGSRHGCARRVFRPRWTIATSPRRRATTSEASAIGTRARTAFQGG